MRLTLEIDRSANPAYVFDASYRITHVNRGYARFARDNDAPPGFLERWGAGASLFDAVPDSLDKFYQALFDRALGGQPAEHDFECHSPARYRLFRMQLFPLADLAGVLVENSLVVDRALDPVRHAVDQSALTAYRSSAGLIRQCAHCRRAEDPATGEWHWVAELIAQPAREVSHGLCAVCLERYYPE